MSIMAALLRRERSGTGEHLDVSIADGALAMMSLYVDEYLATGVEPGPGHYILTGRYACYDVYTCADGRFVAVGAIEPQFWRNLCANLGLERFADAQTDDARQDEIRDAMAEVFATKPRDEWVAVLGPADTCVSPVNTVAEAVGDEQYVARGAIADAVDATARRVPSGGADLGRDGGPRRSVRDPRRRRHRHRAAPRGRWLRDPTRSSALLEEGAIA